MDESCAKICLITEMISISKGVLNNLLIEVLKYCPIDCLKNLYLNLNELPIYKAAKPEQEPEQPKPKPKPVVLAPVPKIVKEPEPKEEDYKEPHLKLGFLIYRFGKQPS